MSSRFRIGVAAAVLCSLCLGFWALRKRSAPPTDVAAAESLFSLGRVASLSVSNRELRLVEYDFAKNGDVEQIYRVNDKTEYGNVFGLSELKPGDNAVVDYTPPRDERLVTTLVKEEVSTLAPTQMEGIVRLAHSMGRVVETLFDGPPAGTDLDADGCPAFLVYDNPGGTQGCGTVPHFGCLNPGTPLLAAQIAACKQACLEVAPCDRRPGRAATLAEDQLNSTFANPNDRMPTPLLL